MNPDPLKIDCDEESVVSDASSTSSGSRRRSYRSRTRKEKQKKRHAPKGKLVSSNQDPLKRAHPTECCFVMKRKDGECPNPEVKLYYRGAYRRYPGQPVGEIDSVWGDNENMINSPTVPEAKLHKRYSILSFHYIRSIISRGYIHTAALFLDDTLEVDVSIAEGSIFGILGSEKRSEKPMTDGEQMASMYSMYTTVRRVLPVR